MYTYVHTNILYIHNLLFIANEKLKLVFKKQNRCKLYNCWYVVREQSYEINIKIEIENSRGDTCENASLIKAIVPLPQLTHFGQCTCRDGEWMHF